MISKIVYNNFAPFNYILIARRHIHAIRVIIVATKSGDFAECELQIRAIKPTDISARSGLRLWARAGRPR